MEEQKDKEKIYCIFNSKKEDINVKLSKAFEIYLKEYTKEELANNRKKH
jgi:hypothetical protein